MKSSLHYAAVSPELSSEVVDAKEHAADVTKDTIASHALKSFDLQSSFRTSRSHMIILA